MQVLVLLCYELVITMPFSVNDSLTSAEILHLLIFLIMWLVTCHCHMINLKSTVCIEYFVTHSSKWTFLAPYSVMCVHLKIVPNLGTNSNFAMQIVSSFLKADSILPVSAYSGNGK